MAMTRMPRANSSLQDFDLKMGRGNCLNYLGSSKFDMSSARYSITTSVPKAVKRVHEIFEKPTFLKDVDGADIKQGGLGDCWFIASLSALANVEGAVKRVCVEYDTRKSPTSGESKAG